MKTQTCNNVTKVIYLSSILAQIVKNKNCIDMKRPTIHIKIDKPMPASVRRVLDEKKERGALYVKGDIKAIREMDKKRNLK